MKIFKNFHLNKMEDLKEKGFTVIKIFSQKEIDKWHKKVIDAILEFPEYKIKEINEIKPGDKFKNSDTIPFVMGGFGAYGNPSSYHHHILRKLRSKIYKRIFNFFVEYNKFINGKYNLEYIFDRLCLRPSGSSTTKESWHRDISPSENVNDIVFGGWINLNYEGGTQYFSCVPGSHEELNNSSGFVKENKTENGIKISINPGEYIIFYQNILHEITPLKIKYDSLRLFLSFRLTEDIYPLFGEEELEKIFEEQGVPRLPSGDYPVMFVNNHMRFHQQKVMEFSEIIDNSMKNTNGFALKVMKSLKDSKLKMWKNWKEKEKKIYYPVNL